MFGERIAKRFLPNDCNSTNNITLFEIEFANHNTLALALAVKH